MTIRSYECNAAAYGKQIYFEPLPGVSIFVRSRPAAKETATPVPRPLGPLMVNVESRLPTAELTSAETATVILWSWLEMPRSILLVHEGSALGAAAQSLQLTAVSLSTCQEWSLTLVQSGWTTGLSASYFDDLSNA
ncbi:hypothetical protein R1flu_007810 [Riccia fluitans]|uniref:Uncharacterized protein n=1 Tax=Riccia fluitans TaxID=41844 RepID=A0ABD1YZW8_9MARC